MKRTRVERRWTEVARMALVGAGCLGGGIFIATTPWAVLAFMPIILGVASLLQAVRTTGVADCPGCGAQIDQLRLGVNDGVLCRACRRFVEGKDSELWLTDDERVANGAIFGAEMPPSRKPIFPPFCPQCMAPATRTLPLVVDVSRNRFQHDKYLYDVPACADHGSGVSVIVGAPFRVGFRSYAYQRAFCEANGVGPAQLV